MSWPTLPSAAARYLLPHIAGSTEGLYAAHFSVMENAHTICVLALRTCGGQAMLKSMPLERLYRDLRCGALMLLWTAELCLDRLGRECLYTGSERDEVIEEPVRSATCQPPPGSRRSGPALRHASP